MSGEGGFPTTRLSALAGPSSADEEHRRASLDALVRAYYKPVYKYVRVRYRTPTDEAEDLTQGFFAKIARPDFFASFDPAKARFRTFLRHCLDQFVSNEHKAGRRLKRGGGRAHVSLDFAGAEAEIDARAGFGDDPEAYFDTEWQRHVLASAIEELRTHCEREDKAEHFAVFERYDLCEDEERPTYRDVAVALGIKETTVTNRLNYARAELRRLAVDIIASVSLTRDELDREARALFGEG